MSLSLRKPTFEVRDVGFGVWGKRPKFLVLALVRFKHHQHRRTSPRLHDIDNRRRSRNSSDTHDNAVIANMRTYDDTFSGQKIYPGKVRYSQYHHHTVAEGEQSRRVWGLHGYRGQGMFRR